MPHSVRRPRLVVLALFALAGLPYAGPAAAFQAGFAERRGAAEMSIDEVIAVAERRYKARVVRHGIDQFQGQRFYVLRLLSEQGRVWTVRVDPRTGAMTQVP
jgi:uncharacterized iron-regulated membrane protein